MVLKSMRWMLRPDSPLYIKPSLNPAFVKFMFDMWRRSNHADQRLGFEGHLRLAQGTVEVFDDYQADGMDFEMHNQGLLMAFTDKENLDHHLDNLDLVRQFDLDPRVLIGDDVRTHEPKLTDAVYGGIYFPLERHLDPGALARALHKWISELGVQIEENLPIDRIEKRGDRVVAVHSCSRRFDADQVVLAAGAWTGPVSKLFGTPLPVRPGKGYSVDVAPYGLRSAINLSDAKVAITPLNDRLRLAGTMEFGGLDETINQVRVDAILRAPRTYFRDWEPPANPPPAQAGCRPMTPDGKPIIGRLGDLTNAYVSTGHGMLGVTLAPGSAAALTELILRDRLSPNLNPFSPARFLGRPKTH
jgi:D-amino-acid dehydrogenase